MFAAGPKSQLLGIGVKFLEGLMYFASGCSISPWGFLASCVGARQIPREVQALRGQRHAYVQHGKLQLRLEGKQAEGAYVSVDMRVCRYMFVDVVCFRRLRCTRVSLRELGRRQLASRDASGIILRSSSAVGPKATAPNVDTYVL